MHLGSQPGRPSRDEARSRRATRQLAVPFTAIAAVGVLSAVVPGFDGVDWRHLALLLVVVVDPLVLLVVLRRPQRTWLDPVPAYLMFPAIALARDIAGGSTTGISPLVGLPVLWLALTGTRRELVVAWVLTAATFVVPTVLVGPPVYQGEEWTRALLWTLFAVLVAPVVQNLVTRLTKAQDRWRVLVGNLPDTTVLVVDEDETVTAAAGAGVDSRELDTLADRSLARVAQEHQGQLLRLIGRAFEGETGRVELTDVTTGKLHEVTVRPMPSDGVRRSALVVARDVSAWRERELALIDANERIERLFADAPHGVAVLTPQGVVQRANQALLTMVGRSLPDVEGRPFHRLVARPDDVDDHLSSVRSADCRPVAADLTLRDRQGNDVSAVLSSRMIRQDDGTDDRILVNVVDVSERRRYEARLAHLADHDVLTGLPNRRRFDAELARHLDRCERYGAAGALLLLDLDHFKQVNDTLGHNAGDQLLVSTAGILRRGLRMSDVVARLGGDEFAVLLPEADCGEAATVARAIVQRVNEHTATLDGVRRRVTASVGVVTFRAARDRDDDILALADMTMYDAKEAGRNDIAVLQEDSTQLPRSGARLRWQSKIEAALEEDGFELLLQPVRNLDSGLLTSAEVLLRLRDGHELVPPSRFLYVAERAGLMPALDSWVVRHALPIAARLQAGVPEFGMAVNLSGLSIGNDRVEREIVRALEQNAVDPDTLVLEITETAAVADVAVARAFAGRMAERGCRLALDDFGAGFGSFYYLKHLIFDYVKIDGEFVQAAATSSIDRAIIRSIVGIAGDLGKKTVAEFVADEATLEAVRAEGVDFAQGYLVGAPMPEADLAEMLRREGGHSPAF